MYNFVQVVVAEETFIGTSIKKFSWDFENHAVPDEDDSYWGCPSRWRLHIYEKATGIEVATL